MRVKMGPISLSFLTDVSQQEVDETERRVVLATKAREERGRGAASATVESSLRSAENGTQVTIVTDLALTGMAAQFGRGLIQDVTAQLLDKFASCLEQQLVTEPGLPAAAPEPPRPVSGLALGAAAMQSWLARHKGLTSSVWAFVFFLWVWLGLQAVDVPRATAFIFGALVGFASFFFIRICSEEDPDLRRLWVRAR
jgi:hypothetical protein